LKIDSCGHHLWPVEVTNYTIMPKVLGHPSKSGVPITFIATVVLNKALRHADRFYKHL